MIDRLNKYVGYFIRPTNEPMLRIDRVIRKLRPKFRTSVALNIVYLLGLVALSSWAATFQPREGCVAVLQMVVVLYVLVATETEAVWKGVLLASGRPARIYNIAKIAERKPPSPKALFLGVVGYGCTILCFGSGAFILHLSQLAKYCGVRSADGRALRCWWEFLYFSGTTITTIGLSSIHPDDVLSQALALCEIALGLFFVVFVFATFVAVQANRKRLS